jgi:hypothetical protein
MPRVVTQLLIIHLVGLCLLEDEASFSLTRSSSLKEEKFPSFARLYILPCFWGSKYNSNFIFLFLFFSLSQKQQGLSWRLQDILRVIARFHLVLIISVCFVCFQARMRVHQFAVNFSITLYEASVNEDTSMNAYRIAGAVPKNLAQSTLTVSPYPSRKVLMALFYNYVIIRWSGTFGSTQCVSTRKISQRKKSRFK